MKVWLVRHAVAHERDRKRWPDDSRRPLTPAGKRNFRKVARGLSRLLPKRIALMSSPWLRAQETAAILAATHGGRVIECRELAGNQPTRTVFELLRLRPSMKQVLVGHEPALSRFLAVSIGAEHARIEFEKGGVACIEFVGSPGPGRGKLRWMLTPRLLRELR